jgi:hypothetical protein
MDLLNPTRMQLPLTPFFNQSVKLLLGCIVLRMHVVEATEATRSIGKPAPHISGHPYDARIVEIREPLGLDEEVVGDQEAGDHVYDVVGSDESHQHPLVKHHENGEVGKPGPTHGPVLENHKGTGPHVARVEEIVDIGIRHSYCLNSRVVPEESVGPVLEKGVLKRLKGIFGLTWIKSLVPKKNI